MKLSFDLIVRSNWISEKHTDKKKKKADPAIIYPVDFKWQDIV